MKKIIALLISLNPMIPILWGGYSAAYSTTNGTEYKIVKNIDAVTLRVENLSTKKIMLIKLMGVALLKQCYKNEANHYSSSILPVGSTIKMELAKSNVTNKPLSTKDNQALAYVWFKDNIMSIPENPPPNPSFKWNMLQKVLLSYGYVKEYNYQQSSYKYQKEFKHFQQVAMDNNQGIWDKCLM